MSRWFRLDDDVINDPKILLLPENMRWIWIAFLCIASKNDGRIPQIKIVALNLRVKEHKAAEYLTMLVTSGLIDKDETGFAPHNWAKRQFKSDVSTDRVKRFRKQERNVSETPPHTQAHTETQSEKKDQQTRKRAARLPADAEPSERNRADALTLGMTVPEIENQWRRMRDWSASSPKGECLDWDARWRNWCETFLGGRNGNGTNGIRAHQTAGPAPTRDTAVIAGMGRALERRRAARAADDPGRQDVRETGCAGPAGGADAESDAASDDDGPLRGLASVSTGHA
jgi:hypothetical protein